MKKSKTEEPKKTKIWIYIAIIVLAILLGLIVHIGRNIHYFSEINQKAEPYLSKTNVYKKAEDKYLVREEWLLDDLFMFKLTNKLIDATTIDITKNGKRVTYENVTGQKIKVESEAEKIEPILDDVVKFSNPFDKVMTALFSKVRVVEEDGKKLYKVSGTRNANFMHSDDTISLDLYLDYETGLLYKISEALRTEEAKVENTESIYLLEFDNNTEDMFKVEDDSEYKEIKNMEENV